MISAALSQTIDPRGKSTFRIVPAGMFKAKDGRPATPNGHWTLTKENGMAIAATLSARASDTVIDYEHASLGGNPAPAAGWFRNVSWRPDGLYVTDARWTAAASKMIDEKEYRYISPVIAFDSDGLVTGLHNIALVNNPALDGLTDLASLSAAGQVSVESMKQRLKSGFAGCSMTDRQKELWMQVWGHTPVELKAIEASSTNSLKHRMDTGFAGTEMTEQQKDYFIRVFGHTPAELRKLVP